jgi:hypothetical protein
MSFLGFGVIGAKVQIKQMEFVTTFITGVLLIIVVLQRAFLRQNPIAFDDLFLMIAPISMMLFPKTLPNKIGRPWFIFCVLVIFVCIIVITYGFLTQKSD